MEKKKRKERRSFESSDWQMGAEKSVTPNCVRAALGQFQMATEEKAENHTAVDSSVS